MLAFSYFDFLSIFHSSHEIKAVLFNLTVTGACLIKNGCWQEVPERGEESCSRTAGEAGAGGGDSRLCRQGAARDGKGKIQIGEDTRSRVVEFFVQRKTSDEFSSSPGLNLASPVGGSWHKTPTEGNVHLTSHTEKKKKKNNQIYSLALSILSYVKHCNDSHTAATSLGCCKLLLR